MRLEIERALRKSKTRREVLEYLASNYPSVFYPAEIAKETRLSPTQVIRAIRGIEGRYEPKNSLISLNLVFVMEGGGRKFYGLTLKGKKVYQRMNSRGAR
jgi:predicted transcriptional regulator with HTH domain